MQNRILDSSSIEPVSCSHLNNGTTIFLVTEAKNVDVIFSFNDFNPPAPLDQESLELFIYVYSHLILICHHATCHACPELLNQCPGFETFPYWKLAVELSLSSRLFFLIRTNLSPVLGLQYISLHCSSIHVTWHLASPTSTSAPIPVGREWGLCL